MIVGIDPGVTGAFCCLDSGGPQVWDLPMIPDGPKSKQLDVEQFSRWLHRPPHGVERVIIERQGPRPHDGVVQAFRTGLLYGQLQAVCASLGIPVSIVSPTVWKQYHGILSPDKKDKDLGRQLALETYPELEPYLRRIKDHNRADAILIAAWGKAHWRGLARGLL